MVLAASVSAAEGTSWTMVRTARRRKRSSPAIRAPRNSGGQVYPNGESYSQRERRLLRECRGLPNAGACRGYTD